MAEQPNIIYIDDDELWGPLLQRRFAKAGLNLEFVHNPEAKHGQPARDLIARIEAGEDLIVLTDWQMPIGGQALVAACIETGIPVAVHSGVVVSEKSGRPFEGAEAGFAKGDMSAIIEWIKSKLAE